MGIINVLDTQTANMIAAGEVVERPASAVKEMIENAIDANATHITCEIKGGGNSYIRITDNGKGIDAEDLPKAILPHATSKIKNASDLDGVLTLGFRGEALAAISSVSRIEILSKTKDSPIGAKLVSDENGVEITEEGAPNGTVITVKDLFYNVPARRKFMKKDSSEASAILNVLTKTALSHPEISFRAISEGVTKFITPGDGDLYSAIYATLGKEYATTLTAVVGVHGEITVGGYISRHGESRGSRSGQYFFVNDRAIQSTQIMAALEQAFRSYMPPKRFPAAVLKINVPPKFVDVNVHPAKTEIKFADDRKIFEAVYSAVLLALQGETQNVVFSKSEDSTQKTGTAFSSSKIEPSSLFPSQKTETTTPFATQETETTTPFATQETKTTSLFSTNTTSTKLKPEEEKPVSSYILLRDPNVPLSSSFENRIKVSEALKNDSTADEFKTAVNNSESSQLEISLDENNEKPNAPSFKVLGEAFGGYIVAEIENALLLIDKHAAHERIIYEDLVSKRTASESQLLLSPHVVKPGIEATEMLLENSDLLLSYGFEIDSFGNDSIAVRAIPATLAGISDIEAILDEFAFSLSNGDRLPFDKKCDRALYTVACKAAIKLGPPSKNEELAVLVEKLLSDAKLKLCPHGRPLLKEISKREIEKFFDR